MADSFYKWVDGNGKPHFADSLSGVPEKYRRQVEERAFKKRGAIGKGSTISGKSNANVGKQAKRSIPKVGEELKRFEVRYKAYERGARRIIVPVTFNGSVTVAMAVDTGAPRLVISTKLADKLGLFEGGEGMLKTYAGGIGGTIPAMLTIIDSARIGGAKDEFIPATITPSISSAFEGLIGMDFMAKFSIRIDTRRHILILEELSVRSDMPAGHDEAWWRINFHRFSRMRNGWKRQYLAIKNGKYGRSGTSVDKMRDFAESQYREADKLFRKLERYANYNAVPAHWRRY